MARTIDQQIASTQAKLARLKTRQKASETRRKIIAHSDTSDQVFRRHMISHSGVSDHPEMTPSGAVW